MPPDNTNIHTILTTALTTPRSSILPDQPSPQQLALLQSLESILASTVPPTVSVTSLEAKAKAEATTATTTFLTPYPYHFPRPQWINLVSFLAFATKKRLLGLEGTALGMLHAALERHVGAVAGVRESGIGKGKGTRVEVTEQEQGEGEGEGEEQGEGLRVLISCAAVWVLVMGEELWERRGRDEEKDTETTTETKSEKETISKETWRAWTDRFQFVSLREDLDLSTRDLAAEAAAVMLRVG